MPELYWHPEAEKEALELSEEKQEMIDRAAEKFQEEGKEYKYFGRVTKKEYDFDKFKLKVKQNNPLKVNQRMILQECHGKWVVLGVEHRQDSYRKHYIDLIHQREY